MKKLTVSAITLGLATLLTGCDKYDVQIPKIKENREYYVAHPDKAEEAWNECKNTFEQIHFIDRNLSREEQKEFELFLAKKGEREYRKNCYSIENVISEAQELERQKEEELKQVKNKKEAIAYIEKLEKEFIGKTWQESIAKIINSDFSMSYYSDRDKELADLDLDGYLQKGSISSYIRYDNENVERYKNDVMTYIYAKQRELGIKELLLKPYNELINDTSYCKTDKRQLSVCEIWQDAVKQERNNIINSYMANYETLKSDYNKCVAKLEDYLASVNVGKNDKNVQIDIYNGIKDTENKIYDSYPCSEAEEALRKLNLNFDHYEKLD